MSPAPDGARTAERVIWHHKIHDQWGEERLILARFALRPSYSAERFKRAMLHVFAEHEVSSYTYYEILGEFDVFLRVWLSKKFSRHAFVRQLQQELKQRFEAVRADVFNVRTVHRHWAWGRQEPDPPAPLKLAEAVTDEELQQIATGQISPERLLELEGANLLTRAVPARGIRLFTFITDWSTDRDEDTIRERLLEIIDDGPVGVTDLSLYEGAGCGRFLLILRTEPSKFFVSVKSATYAINYSFEPVGIRPYTYVAATEAPLFRYDVIRRRGSPTGRRWRQTATIADLVSAGESTVVEYKASALLNFDRFAHSGQWEDGDRSVFINGLAKTICGMFNAAGGSIIVGLAEKNRYLRARSLAGYPTIESADQELLIVGADLRDGESWEQYASRLQEAIDEVIRPRLHAWLRIEKAVVGDRVLAVVHVVPGPTRLWAYVVSGERDSYFYVRREGRTDLLRDLEADIYRSHARTDLEPAD